MTNYLEVEEHRIERSKEFKVKQLTMTQAAILCYETVSLDSFDRAMYWADQLRQHEPACRVFLVATKTDLLECDGIVEEVSEQDALAFKQKIGEFS